MCGRGRAFEVIKVIIVLAARIIIENRLCVDDEEDGMREEQE